MKLRILLLGVAAARLWAAGTCTVQQPQPATASILPPGVPVTSFYAQVSCTADASNGSFLAAPISGLLSTAVQLQGWYVTAVQVTPGSPAPTAGYGLTVTNAQSVDQLGGAAASLSASASQAFYAVTPTPIIGIETVNFTGNSVNSAKTTVNVYFGQTTVQTGGGGSGTVAAGTAGQGAVYTGTTTIGSAAFAGDFTCNGSLNCTVGSIGGKTVSLSGNLTTTGAFNPTFVIPSSSTWKFTSGGGTLLQSVPIVCDGVTDITSALNSAITAASPGTVLVLPSGNCLTTGTGIALVTANITLRGQGATATSILAPLNNNNAVTVSAADDTIEDLAVDGRYSSQTNGGTESAQVGVRLLSGANRLTLRRVWVHDTCGHGVSNVGNGSDLHIYESRFTNGGVAASQVQATPAPTTTTFAVAPGTSGNFAVGQVLRIGTQTGTVQSVQSIKSAVAVSTSTSVFTVNVGDGSLFSVGNVIRVGQQSCTINAISTDQITCSPAMSLTSTIGQIVAIDNVTLTGAITTPTAGNTVAVQGGYLKGVYIALARTMRPIIVNSYFTGWSQAIGLWYGTSHGLIQGNTLIANYGYEDTAHTSNRSAFELYPNNAVGGNHRVIGNIIDGSTHNDIECAQGEVGTRFIGNTLRNWASEVGLGSTGVGLEIVGQTGIPGNTVDIVALGNDFQSNGASDTTGVSVESFTTDVKLVSNNFRGFSGGTNGDGIIVQGSSAGPPTISGNTFTAVAKAIVINVTGTSQGVISTNTFWDSPDLSGSGGINLASGGNGWIITNNICNSNTCLAISAGNQHVIRGNSFNTGSSIPLTLNDSVIDGNTFVRSGVTDGAGALRLLGASLRNHVSGNSITFTGGRTITIESTADYNIVTGNSFPTSTSASGDVVIQSSATHNQSGPNCTNGVCGTSPTWTFGTNTCSATTAVGGATSGTFVSGTTGTCTVVITMGTGTAASPTGWNCMASDRTTPANLVSNTTSSTTTCTVSGTTVSGDVVSFSASPY